MRDYPVINIWKHLWGTTAHKFWVTYYLLDIILNLISRAFLHDLSKYSPVECTAFFRTIHKLRVTPYGTVEYDDLLKEVKPALDHHYKVNRHHPEFHNEGLKKFTLIDLIEMYCDWKAAVRRHNTGNMFRSIEINKDRFKMDDQLIEILRNTHQKPQP